MKVKDAWKWNEFRSSFSKPIAHMLNALPALQACLFDRYAMTRASPQTPKEQQRQEQEENDSGDHDTGEHKRSSKSIIAVDIPAMPGMYALCFFLSFSVVCACICVWCCIRRAK